MWLLPKLQAEENGSPTSCDHLHADALLQALVNRFLGVMPWGVEEGKKADHLPVITSLQSTELDTDILYLAQFSQP